MTMSMITVIEWHDITYDMVMLQLLTTTSHSSILSMITVAPIPATTYTFSDVNLWAKTPEIIQPNWASTHTKAGVMDSLVSTLVVQLSAYNIGISQVPIVITNCAPCVIIKYLHTTLTSVPPSYKSDFTSTSFRLGWICNVSWDHVSTLHHRIMWTHYIMGSCKD